MIQARQRRVRNHSRRLVRRIERRKQTLLREFGEEVHADVQSAMQPAGGDGPSAPGSAPYQRSGGLNLASIQSAIETTGNQTTIKVGAPIKPGSRKRTSKPVPHLIEVGGTAVVQRRSRSGRRGQSYRVRYRARPAVAPAARRALRRFRRKLTAQGIVA